MSRPDEVASQPNPRRVVYTALIDNYEVLNEQPVAADSSVDFVCFTDDPDAASDSWEIRRVTPRFPLDSVRSARYLKINGPDLLPEYDESLWIDNTVLLRVPPERIFDDWLASADLAMPVHSFRTNILAEFDAIATHGLDDAGRVYEQLIHYTAVNAEALQEAPLWTALVARRHTREVRLIMHAWSDHVMRYSRRDQLSVNYVMRLMDAEVNRVAIDNRESDIHLWPQHTERRWGVTHSRLADAFRVPHAEIGRLENAVSDLQEKVVELSAIDHTHVRESVERLNQTYQQSLSWRITRPLRALSRLLRGRKDEPS